MIPKNYLKYINQIIPKNLREATMKRSWVGLHTLPSCIDELTEKTSKPNPFWRLFTFQAIGNALHKTRSWAEKNEQFALQKVVRVFVKSHIHNKALKKTLRFPLPLHHEQWTRATVHEFMHAKSFGFNYHAIELKKQRFLYPKGPDAPTATLADIQSSLHQFTLPVKVEAFGWLIVHPGRPKFRCYLHECRGGTVNHLSTQLETFHRAFVQSPFDLQSLCSCILICSFWNIYSEKNETSSTQTCLNNTILPTLYRWCWTVDVSCSPPDCNFTPPSCLV